MSRNGLFYKRGIKRLMNKDIIVRTDTYPSGEIIPLGITDLEGKTQYIDKVTKKEVSKESVKYFCVSNSELFVLIYKEGLWFLE